LWPISEGACVYQAALESATANLDNYYRVYGALHRPSRDEKPLTPSGPEGSSGSGGIGCRDVAGVKCHPIWFMNKMLAFLMCVRSMANIFLSPTDLTSEPALPELNRVSLELQNGL